MRAIVWRAMSAGDAAVGAGVGEVGCETTGGGSLSATCGAAAPGGVDVGAIGCRGAAGAATEVALAAGAAWPWPDARVGSTGAGEVQPAARRASAQTTFRTATICRANLNLLGSMSLGTVTIAANHR
jgi:hypothetical protein